MPLAFLYYSTGQFAENILLSKAATTVTTDLPRGILVHALQVVPCAFCICLNILPHVIHFFHTYYHSSAQHGLTFCIISFKFVTRVSVRLCTRGIFLLHSFKFSRRVTVRPVLLTLWKPLKYEHLKCICTDSNCNFVVTTWLVC